MKRIRARAATVTLAAVAALAAAAAIVPAAAACPVCYGASRRRRSSTAPAGRWSSSGA